MYFTFFEHKAKSDESDENGRKNVQKYPKNPCGAKIKKNCG